MEKVCERAEDAAAHQTKAREIWWWWWDFSNFELREKSDARMQDKMYTYIYIHISIYVRGALPTASPGQEIRLKPNRGLHVYLQVSLNKRLEEKCGAAGKSLQAFADLL